MKKIFYKLAFSPDEETFLHFDTIEEAEHYKETMGGTISLVENSEEIEDATEMQDIWLEKISRTRHTDAVAEVAQRELAMKSIMDMGTREFQYKLLNGTLPDFKREKLDRDISRKLERSTCHSYHLMNDKQHDSGIVNQGFLKRHKLRYISVEKFKKEYYFEFQPKYDFGFVL